VSQQASRLLPVLVVTVHNGDPLTAPMEFLWCTVSSQALVMAWQSLAPFFLVWPLLSIASLFLLNFEFILKITQSNH
jgi:hypothetical protein